jgi:molybdopterin synthase catalytic subunit
MNSGMNSGMNTGMNRVREDVAVSVSMTEPVRLIDIRDTELSVDEVLRAVTDPHAGAVDLFVGIVRDHTPDRPDGVVIGLEYSAHPDAAAQLAEVARKVAGQHPDTLLAAVHRIGTLRVGDAAVVVAASAAHRAEAFAACRDLIDLLKLQVPIWKKEVYRDGSHTWVGI